MREEDWELSDEARDELESDALTASKTIAEDHAQRADREGRADYVLGSVQGVDPVVKQRYGRWLVTADESLQDELAALAEQPEALAQSFAQVLQVKDGAADAPWAPGTACLNVHTLGALASALGSALLVASNDPKVVLAGQRGAVDLPQCRVVAECLAAAGVVTYLSPEECAAEQVGEYVARVGAQVGICLTAVAGEAPGPVRLLGSDGGPLAVALVERVNAALRQLDVFDDVDRFDLRKALREQLVVPLESEPEE